MLPDFLYSFCPCSLPLPSNFQRGEMKDVSLPLLPHQVPVLKTLQSGFCLHFSNGSALTKVSNDNKLLP